MLRPIGAGLCSSWAYRTTMAPRAGRLSADDTDSITSLLSEVLAVQGSWCNITFEPVDDGEATEESPLFGFLAARGPANPLGTVMAPPAGKASGVAQIGIQHRAGTKAAAQLRDASLTLPTGARVAQDHPRRGLVVEWPDSEDAVTLEAWLFPSMRVLGRAPTTNHVLYEWHTV